MTLALTGASGRIGNVLVRALLEAGHDVRVLQRNDSRALAGLPLQRVRGDLFDEKALDALTQGCDTCFHVAGLISLSADRSGAVRRVNVEGTRRVLEACRRQGVRRVVYFSSVHAFQDGSPDTLFDETRPLALRSPRAYDRSKAEALALAQQWAGASEGELIALCPTGVLGPFDFVPSMAGRMLIDFYRQRIPLLPPGGFDWVDVRDVAEAALTALERGRSGEAYILPGTYATAHELAGLIGRITRKKVPKYETPDWLLRAGVPLAEMLARLTATTPRFTGEMIDTLRNGSRYISGEKARRDLGYATRPLEATISDAYAWFKLNGYL